MRSWKYRIHCSDLLCDYALWIFMMLYGWILHITKESGLLKAEEDLLRQFWRHEWRLALLDPVFFAVLAGSRLLWLPALFSWTRGGWRAGQEHIASLHWLVCFVDFAASLILLEDTTSQPVVVFFFLGWECRKDVTWSPHLWLPILAQVGGITKNLPRPLLPSTFLLWVNLRIIWCFPYPCDLISVSDLMTSEDVWHRQFDQQLHFRTNDKTCLGGRMGLWTYQRDCLLKQLFLPTCFWLLSLAILLWNVWSQAAFWTSLRSPLPVTLRVAWPIGLSHGVLSMTCPALLLNAF